MSLRKKTQLDPPVSGACPTFFKACCREATQGGRHSYKWAAYELVRHLHRLGPDELSYEEWEPELDQLEGLIQMPEEQFDQQAVVQWFQDRLPRCMALVPKRRHAKFVEGVLAYADEQDINQL